MSFLSINSNSSNFSFEEKESDSEALFSIYSQIDENSEFYIKISQFKKYSFQNSNETHEIISDDKEIFEDENDSQKPTK